MVPPRLMLATLISNVVELMAWTYSGSEGHHHWPKQFPTCGGEQQSPINIQMEDTVCYLYPPLFFSNYYQVPMMSFLENGHTVVLTLPANISEEDKPSIQGGGLSDVYIYEQLHFHWGTSDDEGSEHTINSESYAGEMHLVHYNSKYGSYQNALNHSDGLAVLAIFLEPSSYVNEGLESIVKHLNRVTQVNQTAVIAEPVDFLRLLPLSTRKFYRYQGSLTTPPCSEIVTWTVFQDPLYVTREQLAQFRNLKNAEGNSLVNNDRPVQSVNQRTVYSSVDLVFRFDCPPLRGKR